MFIWCDMMKKRKILGIGAVVLMILTVVIPAVNAVSIETNKTNYNDKISKNKIDFDKIQYILEKYKKEIDEIDRYIQEYIEKNGYIDINFELTDELKEKYETIIKEGNIDPAEQETTKVKNNRYLTFPKLKKIIKSFSNYLKPELKNQDPYPCGGGKTDYKRNWIIPYMSYIDQIWLDSDVVFWICKTLGPVGLAAIGIVLTLSGVGAPVAIGFTIASLFTGFGLDQLYELGRENGLYAEITEIFMYDSVPPVLTYIDSQ